MRDPSFLPSRALAHPLWWLALGTLAVNDHLLKGGRILPAALTGKLSDFAGLLVAPVLLAALVRCRSRRGLAAAHLATGAVFAAINLSPPAAAAFEGLMGLTPWPWRIWVDPTDLVALPMLAVSWRVFTPELTRPFAVAPILQRAAALLGGWACVATSPPPEPPMDCSDAGGFCPQGDWAQISDRLVFGNLTARSLRLRVRPLRSEIRLDCEAVAADPGGLLAPEIFGPVQVWELAPNQVLGLLAAARSPSGGCGAWLVDGVGVERRVVFLDLSDTPVTRLPLAANAVDPDRLLPLEVEGWGEHPALFDLPRAEPELPSPECRLPASGTGLAWSAPPEGEVVLRELASAPDGCHRLVVDQLSWLEPWFLCLGAAPLPFEPGESLQVSSRVVPGVGEGVQIQGARHRLRLQRGALEHDWLQTPGSRPSACRPTGDACGQWRIPVEVEITDPRTGERAWLASGEHAELELSRIDVLRAERLVVADTACSPLPAEYPIESAPLVEWVITETVRE